jgi:hypothetical protein
VNILNPIGTKHISEIFAVKIRKTNEIQQYPKEQYYITTNIILPDVSRFPEREQRFGN